MRSPSPSPLGENGCQRTALQLRFHLRVAGEVYTLSSVTVSHVSFKTVAVAVEVNVSVPLSCVSEEKCKRMRMLFDAETDIQAPHCIGQKAPSPCPLTLWQTRLPTSPSFCLRSRD